MVTENITPIITNTDIISSRVKPLWLLRSVFFRTRMFTIGTLCFLPLAVGAGVYIDPSFRSAAAFIAFSSFRKIMRIVELSPLNSQPTTTIVNIVNRAFSR